MRSPYVVGEAKLPAGFPPPGPVGMVIVKQYPAYRAAVVQSRDMNNADMNGMFRPLFNHIKKNEIAMTAPVEMVYDKMDDGGPRPISMAFLYSEPKLGQPGADGVVNVIDLPATTVVSISMRGSYSVATFNKGMEKINKWLAEHSEYRAAGPPRFLGYNSPFVPWFMRLGEVQVPVEKG